MFVTDYFFTFFSGKQGSSSSPVRFSQFQSFYDITAPIDPGTDILAAETDLPLPTMSVDGSAFGSTVRNIGINAVQYTSRPTIQLPATIELLTMVENAEIRYSYFGEPTPKSTLYAGPIVLNRKPLPQSLFLLYFKVYKLSADGRTNTTETSKTVIAEFYLKQ